MSTNIGYHTRLYADPSVKVVGGSFGGDIDQSTVDRLVSAHFTVTVKPSGTAVFVDRQGREVRAYISIDAAKTKAGIAALAVYRADRARSEAARQALEEAQQAELDDALASMTHDEAIRRLKAGG